MAKMSSRLAIETDDLTKRFGGKTAVDHLTLRIPAGTTFGFIGPNGAGKTTTIKPVCWASTSAPMRRR